MTLALAPMEGLVDHHMREFLTRDQAFDFCVTEFLRVTDQLLAERAFRRICPESFQNWKTPSGTPVHLQLLGNDVNAMTDNACRGAILGAPVIDVNFGCPMYVRNSQKSINSKRGEGKKDKPKVNACGESYGGSILLQYPDEIYNLLSTMRKALPEHVPLTAKMRLGYEDKTLAIENAQAIEEAGVSQLCIHARTKTEGYKPPAHWHYIARIKEHVNLPILANGEIWSLDDYKLAKQESNCEHIMLGRGAVANPQLAMQIKHYEACQPHADSPWHDRLNDLIWMIDALTRNSESKKIQGKIKQWLSFMKFRYVEAHEFFKIAKKLNTPEELRQFVFESSQNDPQR
jgi:tRNA-dihydrouridine synthase C